MIATVHGKPEIFIHDPGTIEELLKLMPLKIDWTRDHEGMHYKHVGKRSLTDLRTEGEFIERWTVFGRALGIN